MIDSQDLGEQYQEELEVLTEVLEELVGLEDTLYPELNLVDELALDSLDMLEMFFKIQTKLQRQLNHEQIEQLLSLEMQADQTANIDNNQLVMYSKLKVKHILGYMRRQTRSLLTPEELVAVGKHFEPFFQNIPLEVSFETALMRLKGNNPKLAEKTGFEKVCSPDEWQAPFLEFDLQSVAIQDCLQYFKAPKTETSQFESILGFLSSKNIQEILTTKMIELSVLRVNGVNEEKQSWIKSASHMFISLIGQEQISSLFPGWNEARSSEKSKIHNLIEAFIKEKVSEVLEDDQEKKLILESFLQEDFDPTEDQLFSLGQEQESKNRIVQYYIRSNLSRLIQEFQLNYSDRLFDLLCNESDLEPWSQKQEEFMSCYRAILKSKEVPL